MTFVLDTSILIAIEKRDQKIIKELEKLSTIDSSPPATTFITYFEFLYGLKLKSVKNREKVIESLEEFRVLQTTKATAHILSELKTKYDKSGIKLSFADLLIAAQAIENNYTLVTQDKDFEKVRELNKILIQT